MQQKGIFKFCWELDRNQPEGQIAVFLVLIMAAIFLFTIITINIGQISAKKTALAIATDGAALMLASYLSSQGNAQWMSFMTKQNKTGEEAREEGLKNNWQTCEWCGECVVTFGLAVLATILSFGALSWLTVLAAAASVTEFMLQTFKFTPDAIKGSQKLINLYLEALPTRAQIVELSAHYALNALVDDPTLVKDVHDINENGDTNDWVPAISAFEAERLHDMVYRSEQPIYALRDQIRNFNSVADDFRRYLGGRQAFPEFFYDDFVDNPQREQIARSKYQSDPLLKADLALPNDPYYPENGNFMKLLSDLEVVNLPAETAAETAAETGEKEPIAIKNLDLTSLGQTELSLIILPEYKEEFRYDFKFWEVDGGDIKEVRSKFVDCPGDPYDFMAVDQYNQKTCPDHVDFVVHLLEQWRFWAYGGFMLEKPNDQTSVIFQKGIANLPDSQLINAFNLWYRQLLNIDDYDINGRPAPPPDEPEPPLRRDDLLDDQEGGNRFEQNYRSTLVAQLGLALNMTAATPSESRLAASLGGCPGLSWVRDLDRVRCNVPFFDKINSDYKNKTGYNGLVGKRKELDEKMIAVCKRMGELITAINSDDYIKAHPDDEWGFDCSGCFTLRTLHRRCNSSFCPPGPGSDALISYNLDCINMLKTQISDRQKALDERIAEIPGLITDLQTQRDGCASGTCATEQDQCIANCPQEQDSVCLTGCKGIHRTHEEILNCRAACPLVPVPACVENCNSAYNGCVASCQENIDNEIKALQDELDFRQNKERPTLTKVAELTAALELLAKSFATVTTLNFRIQDAQSKIVDFWQAGNRLYAYIKDAAIISELKKIDQGVPPGLSDLAQTQITYSWVTKDVSGKPVRHYVRVAVNNTFKLPTLKARKCHWIFGRGAKLENHSGSVWVGASRFDEDKNLSVGPKNKPWLNWTLRTSRRIDPALYEEIVSDPDRALQYGSKSQTYAVYSPDVSHIRITLTQ